MLPAALEAEPPFEPLVEPLAEASFFSVSVEEAALELDDGALSFFAGSDEEAALELDAGALELGEVLSEPLALVEPPAALSFFSVEEAALDEEAGGVALPDMELDEELSLFFDASTLIDVEPEPEPEGAGAAELDEAEPEGAAGVVAELDEEEPAPDGALDGVVVLELLEAARSPGLSQPVRIPAPSARETATAKVVSLICCVLRGLGYTLEEQVSGLLQ